MCRDVDAAEGILVTPIGFSELAYNRAENDQMEIILNILSLEELHDLQEYLAIPYATKIWLCNSTSIWMDS